MINVVIWDQIRLPAFLTISSHILLRILAKVCHRWFIRIKIFPFRHVYRIIFLLL